MACQKSSGNRKGLISLFERLRKFRKIFFLLDFDGTISTIVKNPENAKPIPGAVETLNAIGRKRNLAAAVVSGREISFLRKFFGNSVILVGIHGGEISAGGKTKTFRIGKNEKKILGEILKLAEVSGISGIYVERKKISIAVHYRNVKKTDVFAVSKLRRKILRKIQNAKLEMKRGKKVFEIMPAGVGKLKAVKLLVKMKKGFKPVFMGDDETDEEVFAMKSVIGVKVGRRNSQTAAKFFISSPDEVNRFLRRFL
ncbi:MAG: trehalose-phosphatase [Elusimicrobia bacterium]|nr:trehalose-phosphatase [Elusimicrobiota bacterium]